MAVGNFGRAPNYAAVDAAGVPDGDHGHGEPGWALDGASGRFDPRPASDDYTQPGNLFRLLSAQERQDLFDNMAGPLSQTSADVQDPAGAPGEGRPGVCGGCRGGGAGARGGVTA
ncbi:MAG: hypothetical protein MZW92_19150 [Comamonadaceae bacterium]|nr:hypothetical protein [Comamonadaceae bacterium]